MISSAANLNRPSSIAHPSNARFGLRPANGRNIVSSELNVKI